MAAVNIPNCPLNINLLNSVDVFPSRRGAKTGQQTEKLYKISFSCFHLFFFIISLFSLECFFTSLLFFIRREQRLILIKLLIICFCFFLYQHGVLCSKHHNFPDWRCRGKKWKKGKLISQCPRNLLYGDAF